MWKYLGAGSFGHPQAKKYGINKGWKSLQGDDKDTAVFGFAATRYPPLPHLPPIARQSHSLSTGLVC